MGQNTELSIPVSVLSIYNDYVLEESYILCLWKLLSVHTFLNKIINYFPQSPPPPPHLWRSYWIGTGIFALPLNYLGWHYISIHNFRNVSSISLWWWQNVYKSYQRYKPMPLLNTSWEIKLVKSEPWNSLRCQYQFSEWYKENAFLFTSMQYLLLSSFRILMQQNRPGQFYKKTFENDPGPH